LLTRKTHLQHHKKQKIKMTLKKNQSNPRARKEQWTKHKLFYTTQTYLLMRLGVMLP
jgi:fatty acid desaturase